MSARQQLDDYIEKNEEEFNNKSPKSKISNYHKSFAMQTKDTNNSRKSLGDLIASKSEKSLDSDLTSFISRLKHTQSMRCRQIRHAIAGMTLELDSEESMNLNTSSPTNDNLYDLDETLFLDVAAAVENIENNNSSQVNIKNNLSMYYPSLQPLISKRKELERIRFQFENSMSFGDSSGDVLSRNEFSHNHHQQNSVKLDSLLGISHAPYATSEPAFEVASKATFLPPRYPVSNIKGDGDCRRKGRVSISPPPPPVENLSSSNDNSHSQHLSANKRESPQVTQIGLNIGKQGFDNAKEKERNVDIASTNQVFCRERISATQCLLDEINSFQLPKWDSFGEQSMVLFQGNDSGSGGSQSQTEWQPVTPPMSPSFAETPTTVTLKGGQCSIEINDRKN